MAQQSREPQTLDIAEDLITDPSLSRNASFSRLNARAPEFVPRSPLPVNRGGHRVENQHHQHQPVVHVIYHHPPPPPPVSPQFVVPSSSPGIYHHHHHNNHEYYEEDVNQATARQDPAKEGLSDDVTNKITKQVEYYFSDANLATTEHLMRFITKDPDGFVPITVVASFKKIKALVHSNSLLAAALRTSSKLVVSEDGKKVRRRQPFTELDVEDLQSRIVVAENLPDDHCYQRLMKIFSVVGSVKTIRTCYPQAPNGTAAATNRSSKLDMLFANKLHAFVEYESIEDAEQAVAELNDGRNWRNGLRVRLLSSCMVPPKQGSARGRKPGHEGDGNVEEENAFTSDQTKVKHMDQDPSQTAETAQEHVYLFWTG
ncbi:la-related protein 6B-like isoform X2 [Asparagus officinalis]|uniref:la-related protein 6B-like isoform X2 n=1 Tax=Asparagus officinalis TaxID=4686 RepID=UPI00098E08E8|nr:la-related protein 6B-like isoform X2 [Asparagus officinalis]